MSASIQSLFEAIRSECNADTWSRGVGLARQGAVRRDADSADAIVLRVSERGGLLCSSVNLYVDDGDWDCDCRDRDPGCSHAAAAIISLRREGSDGDPQPEAASGRIGYRFHRTVGGLTLDRVVVSDEEDATLKTTLAAIASGRVDGPRFLATQVDLAVERVLGSRLHGALPRGILPRLLGALEGASDVTLDGVAVHTSAAPIGLAARLVDAENGFLLTVGRDPRVTETIGVDTVLCGDTLHPVGATNLTGREADMFTRGRLFRTEETAELMTAVLPSLAERLPIDVQTERLPKMVRERPRLALDVRRERDELAVLPTIVYGDPPIARVDADRLIPLGGPIPHRDAAAERALIRRIHNELQLAPGRWLRLTGSEAVEFAARLEAFEGEIAGVGREAFRVAEALVPRVRVDGARLEIRFETGDATDSDASGARNADPTAVLRAWREGSTLVPLTDHGWAPLPTDWLDRFGDRIADLLAARDDNGDIARCAQPELATLCEDLGEPVPPALEELRDFAKSFEGIPRVELPEDLTGTLRSYQSLGVDWLCMLRDAGLGALLADDMGLGKTVQALCAVRGRTLVVAPTSVLHNWQRETARFRPALRCHVYHGPRRALDPAADVTLTSYAILRLDAEALTAVDWDTVILDEAQAIKNPDSQISRAAYRLPGRFRVTLSGTPVENRLDELWSQFHFLNRGLLGSRRDFEDRYARPIAEGDPVVAERLRARIRPFLLRRLKADVAPELPPRTDVVLRATLKKSERETYDAVRAATLREVVERLDARSGVLAALEALLRLRQAACHPALLPGQHAESSSKIELLLEWIEEAVAEDHKMLVFSQWTALLDLVEPHLEAAGYEFARIDGSTRDRGGVVDRFQSADGPPILLASLKAGGVGLNLTAADHVFILDPWWNPFAEDQAADRAHRIGQDRPVSVYRLVSEGTVEERVLALQEQKRAIADVALGAAGGASSLTREDLLALLE